MFFLLQSPLEVSGFLDEKFQKEETSAEHLRKTSSRHLSYMLDGFGIQETISASFLRFPVVVSIVELAHEPLKVARPYASRIPLRNEVEFPSFTQALEQ